MLPCSWLTRNLPEGIQMEMQSSPQWRKKYLSHLMGISSLNNCNTAKETQSTPQWRKKYRRNVICILSLNDCTAAIVFDIC